MDLDDKKRFFREVLDIIKNKYSVYAWKKTSERLLKARLDIRTVKKNNGEIHLKIDDGCRYTFKKIISGSGKIYLYVPAKLMVFSVQLYFFDDDKTVIVSFPEKLFFDDRRRNARTILDIPKIYADFKMENRVYRRTCYDISLGGLSIIFGRGDNFLLNSKNRIKEVKIIYIKSSMKITIKVVNILSLTPYMLDKFPYANKRVSFKFQDVGPEALRFINKVIVENLPSIKKGAL